MIRIVAIALSLLVFVAFDAKACEGAYLTGHAGHTLRDRNWMGDTPTTLSAGYNWRYKRTGFYYGFRFEHISNFSSGAPFNDDAETTRDAFMFGFHYWDRPYRR